MTPHELTRHLARLFAIKEAAEQLEAGDLSPSEKRGLAKMVRVLVFEMLGDFGYVIMPSQERKGIQFGKEE